MLLPRSNLNHWYQISDNINGLEFRIAFDFRSIRIRIRIRHKLSQILYKLQVKYYNIACPDASKSTLSKPLVIIYNIIIYIIMHRGCSNSNSRPEGEVPSHHHYYCISKLISISIGLLYLNRSPCLPPHNFNHDLR